MVVAQFAPAALIACAVGGCDSVLGLTTTQQVDARAPDASPRPGCVVGHDEDGDGIDDCVDNCPGIANPQQEDVLEIQNGQAADGIGDVCDPAPTKSGDRLLRFISFAEPNAGLEWNTITGNWSVTADALVFSEEQLGGIGIVLWGGNRPRTQFAVAMKLRVDSVDYAMSTSNNASVAVLVDSSATVTLYRCHLDHDYGAAGYADQVAIDSSIASPTAPMVPGTIGDGATFEVRGSFGPGTTTPYALGCSAKTADGIVYAVADAGNQDPTDSLGFAAFHMNVRVEYLEIYDVSGEAP